MKILEILALALGLASTIGGGLAWYAASVRKGYAAEREFTHIRNGISQLTENLKIYIDEVEEIGSKQKEMNILLTSLNTQLGILSAKIDVSTGGIARNQ